MKTLLAFAVLSGLATAAHAAMPCQLTDDDRQELAASPAKLSSPQAIEALAADKKAKVCKSMATIHSLQQGGKLSTTTDASTSYLGPNYKSIYDAALDDLFREVMLGKGFGTKLA